MQSKTFINFHDEGTGSAGPVPSICSPKFDPTVRDGFAGKWETDRFGLYSFTRAKSASTKCISSDYRISWKLECFVESFLLKWISSEKAHSSQALWHS